jgi:hypothetical protein
VELDKESVEYQSQLTALTAANLSQQVEQQFAHLTSQQNLMHKNMHQIIVQVNALSFNHSNVRHGRFTGNGNSSRGLGWEFQFLVPISGTPIGSGIPIPFLIPKIPVGFFFSNSAVEKSRNWNSDSKIWNSEKIRIGIQYTSSQM